MIWGIGFARISSGRCPDLEGTSFLPEVSCCPHIQGISTMFLSMANGSATRFWRANTKTVRRAPDAAWNIHHA